jgi:hypothetical protein
VLADYFDYIAGTSTGAIIATALAFGKPVTEVQEMYRTLGGKIFSKRLLPFRLRSIYRDGPLARELESFYGPDRTLGDPELRSLLLLVLHNTGTDSPWPVSNCTRAKYNRADRYLKTPPDRNLDLALSPLVRASAAAPVFFPPQEVEIGSNRFVFQDGGITPYNNPALILFLSATLPEYGLAWPTGPGPASAGLGRDRVVRRRASGLVARQVNLAFNAKNLAAVFMNGASTVQDVLCRSLGLTVGGTEIDREFGSRIGADGVGGQSLFTYVRYNADLSEDGLRAEGVTDAGLRRSLRKLDSVDRIPDLEALGRKIGERADFTRELAGFTPGALGSRGTLRHLRPRRTNGKRSAQRRWSLHARARRGSGRGAEIRRRRRDRRGGRRGADRAGAVCEEAPRRCAVRGARARARSRHGRQRLRVGRRVVERPGEVA